MGRPAARGRVFTRGSGVKMHAKGSYRMRRATAAGLFGLLLLTGCAKEPKGQILAIVNGHEISTEQLTAELQDFPIPDYVDRRKLRDTVLTGVIDRELQVEEARKQGLDKTPEFQRLKARNADELLVAMLGHKVAQTVPLPADIDVQTYIQAHPLQFARRERLTFDQLSFMPPKDRRQMAAALANVHSLDAAAAALQAIGIATTPGQGVIDTGGTSPELAAQLDGAPAGEPILLPQGDRLILGVISSREPVPMSKETSYIAGARAVRAASLLRESEAQIDAARSKAEIQYTPGYEPDGTVAKKH